MKHLLVDLSGHGFGHLGQTSTVLNALAAISPDFKLTIRSTLPEAIVRSRIHHPFTYSVRELDKGMVMHDAVRIDEQASLAWYEAVHQDFAARIETETAALDALQVDVLFANIPYLSLLAANRLHMPALALCSLNWFDILGHYCCDLPEAQPILEQIRQAYSLAQVFLQPEPSIPMRQFANTLPIAPIAARGESRRVVLQQAVPASTADSKFILVSLGGIHTDFAVQHWPQLRDVYWIMPPHIQHDRADMIAMDQVAMPFIDLLTTVDLVITKTGYGMIVEATCNQTPVLCVKRGDWPEEEVLFPWGKAHGYLHIIDYEQLLQGEFVEYVRPMLQQPWDKPVVEASGGDQAAQIIQQFLHGNADAANRCL